MPRLAMDPQEFYDAVSAAIDDGDTDAEIAAALGCSPSDIVRVRAYLLDPTLPSDEPIITNP